MLNGEERVNETLEEYARIAFKLSGYEVPDQRKLLEDLLQRGVNLNWWAPVDQHQLDLIALILGPGHIINYKGYTLDPISRNFTAPDSPAPIKLSRADTTLLRPMMTVASKAVPTQILRQALEDINLCGTSLKEDIKHLRRRISHTEEYPLIHYVPKRTYKFDPQF